MKSRAFRSPGWAPYLEPGRYHHNKSLSQCHLDSNRILISWKEKSRLKEGKSLSKFSTLFQLQVTET